MGSLRVDLGACRVPQKEVGQKPIDRVLSIADQIVTYAAI